jgi:spore cortex formation protein SpoVR/YcgB (stage V sporulation)
MNEGWACFWHYTLLHDLYKDNLVTDAFMLEILQSHTNVVMQPAYNSPYYSGINPYTLGYNMMQDIKRICENPTDEDKKWFPNFANTNWLETLNEAMRYFKDESFIAQYLSPKIIRDLKLFQIVDDDGFSEYKIASIHNEDGYQKIREALSAQYNIGNLDPDIQVYSVDLTGDRTLTLHYQQRNRVPLGKSTEEVLKHVYALWKYPVVLKVVNEKDEVISECRCPATPVSPTV